MQVKLLLGFLWCSASCHWCWWCLSAGQSASKAEAPTSDACARGILRARGREPRFALDRLQCGRSSRTSGAPLERSALLRELLGNHGCPFRASW